MRATPYYGTWGSYCEFLEILPWVIRACLFSKLLFAQLQESWNSSICLYEIKRKNLFKSTCPTGSFTCPGPSNFEKRGALGFSAINHYLVSLSWVCLKINNIKYHWNLPGANELRCVLHHKLSVSWQPNWKLTCLKQKGIASTLTPMMLLPRLMT